MKLAIFSAILLLLVGCAQPGYAPDSNGAYATYQAVSGRETAVAAYATSTVVYATSQAQAQQANIATATAVAVTATAESLYVQRQQVEIQATATAAAILNNALATSEAQKALFQQHEAALEAQRLARVNDQMLADLEWQRRKNIFMPILYSLFALALVALILAVVYRMVQFSRPVSVPDGHGGMTMALPTGAYQLSAVPRLVSPAREDPPLLPSPIREIKQLPALPTGHALIAGETGSGKSTAMKAVISTRQNVVILDPHDSPGEWGNARVIGGGRNWDAIADYLDTMQQVLQQRYQQRANGKTDFETLTVCTDEMPAIVANCGRMLDSTWRSWLREGRKVGLFFVTSSQSTRVQTLGIKGEGDLLENFGHVIVLGKLAVIEYGDMVKGMKRPAVLHTIEGAQPIIIPNTQIQGTRQASATPLFVAPVPRGKNTKWGYITAEQVDTILTMYKAGESGRAIQRSVFNYEGGAAYHMVNEVLESVDTVTEVEVFQ